MKKQHVALIYVKGKLYLDPINGGVTVHSILKHPEVHKKIRHSMPKTQTASLEFSGIDGRKALNKDKCCFQLGDSKRLYVVTGRLPNSKAMDTEDRDRRGGTIAFAFQNSFNDS